MMPMQNFDRRDFLRVSGAGFTLPLVAGFSAREPVWLPAMRQQAQTYVESGVPSLSLAVFHRGCPIWVEAFGWADRERQTPARTTTPYAVGSASKPFTGMAVAQLIAGGQLILDEPIQTYLRGISIKSSDGARVTVRQALQHRTGIPRHWRNFFAGQGKPPPFTSVARDYAFTTGAHGKRYLYTNMNYGLLAAAVEAVTGKRFHDHLRDKIFRPLGLTAASPLESHFDNWRAATPYEEDDTPIPPYIVDEMGARDLVMSALDLARFGLAHLRGGRSRVTSLMLNERATLGTNNVGRASYGLGWIIEEESPAALFSYGHSGEGPGAASSLTVVPSEELVVATIANQQGPAAYMLNEMIVDAISPIFGSRRKAHPFQEVAADEEAMRGLAGRWKGELKTPEAMHQVSITLSMGLTSQILLSGQQSALTALSVRAGVLSGRAAFGVPTHDAQRWPHQARLSLELSGEHLDGTLAAYASRGKIPHDQFWLSYPLRLQRA